MIVILSIWMSNVKQKNIDLHDLSFNGLISHSQTKNLKNWKRHPSWKAVSIFTWCWWPTLSSSSGCRISVFQFFHSPSFPLFFTTDSLKNANPNPAQNFRSGSHTHIPWEFWCPTLTEASAPHRRPTADALNLTSPHNPKYPTSQLMYLMAFSINT